MFKILIYLLLTLWIIFPAEAAIIQVENPELQPLVEEVLGEGVAARVGEEIILMDEYLKAAQAVKSEVIQTGEISIEAEEKMALRVLERSVLEQLIDSAVVTQGARRLGIRVGTLEVWAKIEEVKNRYPSLDEFRQSLTQQGIEMEDLKEDIRRQLLIKKLTKHLGEQVEVGSQEAEAFYLRNRDIFIQPERVRMKHILVSSWEKAREIVEKLRVGEDFSELAKDYSKDKESRDRGGDLGLVERGELPPEVEEMTFILKPGSISPIIESVDGYHIVKVDKRMEAKETPFGQVRERIETFLLEEKSRTAFGHWLAEEKAKTKIIINDRLRGVIED